MIASLCICCVELRVRRDTIPRETAKQSAAVGWSMRRLIGVGCFLACYELDFYASVYGAAVGRGMRRLKGVGCFFGH